MINKRKMKNIATIFLLFIFLLFTGSRNISGSTENKKAARARGGVVRILVNGQHGIGLGSGFGVGRAGEDADTFVTNWHVVTDDGSFDPDNTDVYILLDDETYFKYEWIPVMEGDVIDENGEYAKDAAGSLYQRVLTDVMLGSVVKCEVVYAEKQYPDVAILHTENPVKNVKTIPLKHMSQDYIGSKIYTLGYPSSADAASRTITKNAELEIIKGSEDAISMDDATISRCSVFEAFGNTECIVHHAHINHGNSGGPLVMEDGSVIGINTYGYGENGLEYSVSIYIDYAIKILDDLSLPYTLAENNTDSWETYVVLAAGAGIFLMAVALTAAFKMRRAKPSFAGGITAEQAVLAAPKLYMQGVSGYYAQKSFPLGKELRIGRDPGKCNLVYPAMTKGVSGVHCVIRTHSAAADITDLSSTYGTVVNGKKLMPDQPYTLASGDHIFIGSVNEEFQITGRGGI